MGSASENLPRTTPWRWSVIPLYAYLNPKPSVIPETTGLTTLVLTQTTYYPTKFSFLHCLLLGVSCQTHLSSNLSIWDLIVPFYDEELCSRTGHLRCRKSYSHTARTSVV